MLSARVPRDENDDDIEDDEEEEGEEDEEEEEEEEQQAVEVAKEEKGGKKRKVEPVVNRRPPELVHSDVVEYLKSIPRELKATFVDIQRELGINLSREQYVLDMLKSNPKIEYERSADDELSFQYRFKFVISNKRELMETIRRVSSGVSSADICEPPCYPGIGDDINNLIVGGEIIACKNKALKSAILYPRGKAFYTPLSGIVTANPGRQAISTNESLVGEIRRGDAIGVGDPANNGVSWYRVSSNVFGYQGERATAPLSVTSEVDLSDKNVYRDTFDSKELPLDGDFDGDDIYKGVAIRHGVTNDARALWTKTLPQTKLYREGNQLRQELVKCKLLSGMGIQQAALARPTLKKKERKKRKPRDTGRQFNSHIKGTALEEAITKAKEEGCG